MIELVKKTMLAGVGLAVVTKDKILESLNEYVEKGKLTQEEAAAMSDKIVDEGRNETKKAKAEASKLFNEMLHRANVVTKDQYDELATRITALEGKLHRASRNEDQCLNTEDPRCWKSPPMLLADLWRIKTLLVPQKIL